MCTSHDLKQFASDCGYNRGPFVWNQLKRVQLIAELDAIFAHLYKLTQDDYEYILSTFRIQFPGTEDYALYLKKYDEMKSLMEEIK